jgi:hypothetical protein
MDGGATLRLPIAASALGGLKAKLIFAAIARAQNSEECKARDIC